MRGRCRAKELTKHQGWEQDIGEGHDKYLQVQALGETPLTYKTYKTVAQAEIKQKSKQKYTTGIKQEPKNTKKKH